MKTAFNLFASPQVVTGTDRICEIGSLLKEKSIKKVVILIDSGIEKTGIAAKIRNFITAEDIQTEVISGLPREPGDTDLDTVMEKVKSANPDAIVAVGGGSVLDVGKLCAVLTNSDKTVLDLLDGAEVPPHSTFTALVPTTAGTGSEATRNAIIAIPSRNTKGAVVNEKLLPDLVILDPALTLTLPEGISATTGMDALCHAVECYLSVKANDLSDLLAVDAIKRIARSIRKVIQDGSDIDARSDMLLASYYAGMCISLSGTNAVHALSYPLGATFHIPHGQSNAMLLPFVMEHNLKAIPEKTAVVAECFGYDSSKNSLDPSDYLVKELHSFLKDLKINTSLSFFGVKKEDIGEMVENAYSNRRLMDNNPVDLTKEQIEAVYKRLLEE